MPYIDSEVLKNKIFPYGMTDNGNYGINAKSVMVAIEKSPSADVVPKADYIRLLNTLKAHGINVEEG